MERPSSGAQSTLDAVVPFDMEDQLVRILARSQDEQFEAGVESRLARDLQRVFASRPLAVLQALRKRLGESAEEPEILAETLQWASRIDGSLAREAVIDLLLTGLHHGHPLVRDSAALALADFDEEVALKQIRRAMERESVPEMREDLESLMRSLEA